MTYNSNILEYVKNGGFFDKEKNTEKSDVGRHVATNVESWSEEQRAYALQIAREEGFSASIIKGYTFPAGNKADGFTMHVPVGKSAGNFWKKMSEKYPTK